MCKQEKKILLNKQKNETEMENSDARADWLAQNLYSSCKLSEQTSLAGQMTNYMLLTLESLGQMLLSGTQI